MNKETDGRKARKTYSIESIKSLKTKFAEVPEVTKVRELTASEAVKEMAKEINAMQKKGYTLAMILNMLKDNNVDVSLATLKTAIANKKDKKNLQEAKKKAKPTQQKLLDTAAVSAAVSDTLTTTTDTTKAKKSANFTDRITPDSEV